MRVFELHASNHVGNLVNGSEAGGPVRDRETGVIAGDQGSRDDEDKSRARSEDGEGVVRAIVRFGQGVQNLILNARSWIPGLAALRTPSVFVWLFSLGRAEHPPPASQQLLGFKACIYCLSVLGRQRDLLVLLA